jgi:molybdopterin-guanine dinucleotide biosynthesis protein A
MGGADKALAHLAGRNLLEHCLQRLPQHAQIALNTNSDASAFTDYGLPILPDSSVDDDTQFRGPLAGILSGLDWAAAQGHHAIITLAVDTPFFPTDLAHRLQDAQIGTAPSLAAERDTEGQFQLHPTFGCWPVSLREDLRNALARGERKIRRWAAEHDASLVEFAPQKNETATAALGSFFNINAPEDLKHAEQVITAE